MGFSITCEVSKRTYMRWENDYRNANDPAKFSGGCYQLIQSGEPFDSKFCNGLAPDEEDYDWYSISVEDIQSGAYNSVQVNVHSYRTKKVTLQSPCANGQLYRRNRTRSDIVVLLRDCKTEYY